MGESNFLIVDNNTLIHIELAVQKYVNRNRNKIRMERRKKQNY